MGGGEPRMLSQEKLIRFQSLGDSRGELISLEGDRNIPFSIKRMYYMYDFARGSERGFHAHLELEQVAVCLSGSCVFEIETVNYKKKYVLDSADQGLYMGGVVWREIRSFSQNCVIAVLASEYYSEKDYLRNYGDFLALCKRLRTKQKT